MIENTTAGALKVLGLPERVCYKSFKEFIESIPTFIGVEVPSSIIGVVVGPNPPGEGQRNALWARRQTNGEFLGIYAFQAGAWRILYQQIPGVTTINWFVGNSLTPPDGFTVIEENDPTMPSTVSNGIRALFIPNPIGPGFSYFAARFSGF